MSEIEIKNKIESLLFISHKPLAIKEMAKLTGCKAEEAEKAVEVLEREYEEKKGGIKIMKLEDKYQMTTSSDSSEIIKLFIKTEVTGELTRPALEALTIIAYRGPISKAELELIRGVNCSMILRNLLMRGLIDSKEDKTKMATVYNITFEFLKFLGLSGVEDLPDFEKLNRNNNLEKLLAGLGAEKEENK